MTDNTQTLNIITDNSAEVTKGASRPLYNKLPEEQRKLVDEHLRNYPHLISELDGVVHSVTAYKFG